MKQRLVGAAVLVAIGIIAWSVVFDPSQVDRFSQRTQIPPRPDFEDFDVAAAERPEGLRRLDYEVRNIEQLQQQRDAGSSQPADRTIAEVPPAPADHAAIDTGPGEDEFGLPMLWAVQLGSFGKLENAQELKQKLEQAGYHVIVQSVAADDGRLTRVFIDPKTDRRGAERLRDKVDGKFGTQALVVRYYPG